MKKRVCSRSYVNELLSFVDVPQDGVDVDVATSRAKRLRRGAQVDGDVVAVEVIGHHQRIFSIDACFERRRKPRVERIKSSG